MSDTTSTPGSAAGRPWAGFLCLGVALILLGAALGGSTLLPLTSLLLFGPLLLAQSLVQAVLAALTRPLPARWLHLISAALSAVVGFLVMIHAVESGTDLALLVAAFLAVAGLGRVLDLGLDRSPGRGWVAAAGALALALAGCVYLQGPTRGLWLISASLALDFVGHGLSWTFLSMTVRGEVESPVPEADEVRAPAKKPVPVAHR
jgi:uncharacterized membrane protein HdeD (DUF308 family)